MGDTVIETNSEVIRHALAAVTDEGLKRKTVEGALVLEPQRSLREDPHGVPREAIAE